VHAHVPRISHIGRTAIATGDLAKISGESWGRVSNIVDIITRTYRVILEQLFIFKKKRKLKTLLLHQSRQ